MSDLARLIIPALRLDQLDPESGDQLPNFYPMGLGGMIIFGGTREQVLHVTANLQADATHPLLIGSDLERGAGQQVRGLTQLPPALAVAHYSARRDDDGKIGVCAAWTASEARRVGINWVLAPVLDLDIDPDNPIVQTRSFGADPDRVGRFGRRWVEGCQIVGPLACAKHFPGHGRTTQDSHATLPVVGASRQMLEADLAPFRAVVEEGVASIMTAHVAYPALDPTGAPATFSKPILDLLRRDMAYDGLVVTDALIMEGAASGSGEAEAAVRALNAGCDLLLYPNEPLQLHAALDHAVRSGALSIRRVDEALERVARAADRTTRHAPFSAMGHEHVAEGASDLAAWCVVALRGAPPTPLSERVRVDVIDDDLGGPYPVPARDAFVAELLSRGVHVAPDGLPVVLLFADVKSWKGRAGLSPQSAEQLRALAPSAPLVVLFGHPRRAAELTDFSVVLCAWSGDIGMQRAAARALVDGLAP